VFSLHDGRCMREIFVGPQSIHTPNRVLQVAESSTIRTELSLLVTRGPLMLV
jgi:hypothetical protein